MGEERREFPRHEAAVLVTVKDAKETMTRNLSQGGCLVISPTSRTIGARVPLILTHPKTGEKLHLEGEIRRCDALGNATFGPGVKFIDLDEAARARIQAFVERSVAVTGRSTAIEDLESSVSMRARLRIDAELHKSVSPAARKVADLVNGKRTVADLLTDSGLPREAAAAGLLYLIRAGVATVVPPGFSPERF